MWYMCGGASAHFSRALRDVLSNTYHDRCINREWPTAWLPCSLDLNLLDFYLWGHLKTLVYAVPIDNEEALDHRILDACQTIRNYLGVFKRMRWSMKRRVEACIESHGGHLSTYYKCTLSAITHKLKVFGHIFITTFFLVLICETHSRTLSSISFTLSIFRNYQTTCYSPSFWLHSNTNVSKCPKIIFSATLKYCRHNALSAFK
jgi:hypothetical protein